jgi:hypothetical protein
MTQSIFESIRAELLGIAPAVEELVSHQGQCDRDGVIVSVSRQALDEVIRSIEGINTIVGAALSSPVGLDAIPVDLEWLIGKGKTRPDEPLYGVQFRKAGTDIILAEAEHDDLAIAINLAIAALPGARS